MQTTITIPYPPTVNNYWGFHGHRRFLTDKAQAFKREVQAAVLAQPIRFGNAPLYLAISLSPPDKRKRDIDNILKPAIDAMMQAGLFADDSQIELLVVARSDVCKGGKAVAIISESKGKPLDLLTAMSL